MLSWVTIGLIAIQALALAAAVIAEVNYRSVLEDLRNGSPGSVGELRDARDALDVTAGIFTVAFLAAAAVFVAWFYRAYRNLRRLSVAGLRYNTGWAIGAWFVPILSLFRPKQIANDVWRASDPEANVTSNAWQSRPVSPLLHWWWALWLVGGALSLIAGVVSDQNSGEPLVRLASIKAEESAATWHIVADAMLAAGAVLGALVVHRVGTRQDALIALAPASPLLPPPSLTQVHGAVAQPGSPMPPPPLPGTPQASVSSAPWLGGLSCPICGWRFKRWDQVGEHVGIHHPREAASLLSRPPSDNPPRGGPA